MRELSNGLWRQSYQILTTIWLFRILSSCFVAWEFLHERSWRSLAHNPCYELSDRELAHGVPIRIMYIQESISDLCNWQGLSGAVY